MTEFFSKVAVLDFARNKDQKLDGCFLKIQYFIDY